MLNREKCEKFELQKVHVSFKHTYLRTRLQKKYVSQAPPSRQFWKIYDPVPLPFFFLPELIFPAIFIRVKDKIPFHKEADSHLTGLLTVKVKGCTQVAVRAEKA